MEVDFINLINNNRALIFKVCNLYCRDPESRKDLFQEVVLQLWKSFPGFRKESAHSTWIYKVAINTAISNLRKESRKPEKHSLHLEDTVDNPRYLMKFWKMQLMEAEEL